MKKMILFLIVLSTLFFTVGCNVKDRSSEAGKEAHKVNQQQSQYSKGQPVPAFDWSLERHLMGELYKLRNKKVATHAVWRSDRGMIEGDCPSLGYGLPYDVSLTNPVVADWYSNGGTISIEQPEPNGIFASKNTSATWVMCTGPGGSIEPIYVESKVTIYPYPLKVDYKNNRVRKAGKASATISKG